MRLTLAMVLSGVGLAVGLVCDVAGARRRRALAMATSSTAALPVPDARTTVGDRRASPPPKRWVGGLDGCRRGWVLVMAPSDGSAPSSVQVVSDVKEVLALLDSGALLAVGIDIPIGLPAIGPRRCDVAARRRIGRRGSSVFPAPPRALLGSRSYEEACARGRAVSGKAISRQSFGILPKIESVDDAMTPDRQYGVVEVHPELSFTVLAGHPMEYRKALPEGRAERLRALHAEFGDVQAHVATPPRGARPDDVLDAYAAAFSARRWLLGTYERLGGELDPRGLRMEIIA